MKKKQKRSDRKQTEEKLNDQLVIILAVAVPAFRLLVY